MHAKATLRQLALVAALVVTSAVGGIIVDRQLLADPGIPLPPGAPPNFSLIAQAWDLVKHHYVDRAAIKPRQMTYGAIAGMIDALGDTGHTSFLTPDMVRDEKDVTHGEFAGVGAEIQMKDGRVVIVTPMDGSPAKAAGIRPGEIIAAVNGKSVAGLPLVKVANLVRGPAGTRVTLTLTDAEGNNSHDVTVVRGKIPVVSVWWHMLPGTHVAHLRIGMFSKGTTDDVDKALAAARAAGATSLVLDLRNDPGGLLEEAVGVASCFLSGGNVLLERDAHGHTQAVPVEDASTHWTRPMVVLINGGTASGAEIVSGAIKDAGRAKVIGETTFGTGTVLQQFPLADGSALQLAIEEWLTPDGTTIWHKGIKPDIVVKLPKKAVPLLPQEERNMTPEALHESGDTQLLRALKLLAPGPTTKPV